MHDASISDLGLNKKLSILIENEEKDSVLSEKNVLGFKDQINLSDRKYSLMIKAFGLKHLLPSISKIRKKRTLIDSTTILYENSHGIYADAEIKIYKMLVLYHDLFPKIFDSLSEDENKVKCIRIKLSGDGTNVGHLHILNFTFSLPDFKYGQAAKGNFSLGAFEINSESYDELNSCFTELNPMLKNIKSFKIGEQTFNIKFYLAGDLKFLANMLGINQANSNLPCIWCKCPKTNCDSLEWSISDLKKGARSHEESEIRRVYKNVPNKLGYIKSPIFDFIPFENVIIELMHLNLRITDKFTEYIIDEITALDIFESQIIYESHTDSRIKDSINIYKYITFLTEICKIRNCFHLKGGKIVFRDLRGQEKLNVFSLINLVELFPTMSDVINKNNVVNNFHNIYIGIRDNILSFQEIKEKTAKFFIDYTETFMVTTITPYIHCFVCHMHEFRKLHGNFNLFNQQGLEKLNDITTEQVFRGSNRKRKESGKNLI